MKYLSIEWSGCLPGSSVEIDYDPSRQVLLPEAMAGQREQTISRWEGSRGKLERDADGELPLLYRYLDCSEHNGILLIRCGRTDYAEYLATNVERPELRADLGTQAMADPLAISACLITSDERILIGRRSTATAEGRGLLHVAPSGHLLAKQTALEGLYQEMEEETGVMPRETTATLCTGLIRVPGTEKPELLFLVSCALTLDKVLARRPTGAWEFDHFFGVAWEPEETARFLVAEGCELVAPGRACMLLGGRARFGEGWFRSLIGSIDAEIFDTPS